MRKKPTGQRPSPDEIREAMERLSGMQNGLGGITQGLGQLFETIESLSHMAADAAGQSGDGSRSGGGTQSGSDARSTSFNQEGSFSFDQDGVAGVFGIKVKMGLDGLETQNFGNIRAGKDGAVVDPSREPMADLFEDDGKTSIVIELPGVGEDEVRIDAQPHSVAVTTTGKRQYAKTMELDRGIQPASMVKRMTNGILELNFDQEKS